MPLYVLKSQLYGRYANHTLRATAPHPWYRPMVLLRYLLTPLTPAEKAGFERTQWFQKEGQGYFEEQSTQPQTLGYSLADSPAGLLGWIYEKLVNWSDEYPWTDDEGQLLWRESIQLLTFPPSVLTWISIYWFSRSGPAASVRIYYEFKKSGSISFTKPAPVNIPTGHSFFPKEVIVLPH